MIDVDKLAQEIRRVDGNHSLGAAALAEALLPFLSEPTEVTYPHSVAPVDIYRVLKVYHEQDRFNWNCASALCRDIAALFRQTDGTITTQPTP